ncbi:Sec1-like protein [Mrakia frigida]|uniref:Sec1p n=1 Tax=Mrakia frigida TaxID=29902 RepID=UPI003FCC1F6D
MAPSLIDIIKTRLLEKIRTISPSAWKVLVVDDYTRELLEEVMNVNEILNLNVTVIDSLQSARRPEPSLPVIYLITPTTQNVQRIVADFQNGRKGYKEVHVVFIDVAPDRLVQMLSQGVGSENLKTLQEVYLNFWPLESQVFTSRTPWAFYSMYGPAGTVINQEMALDALEDDLTVMSRTVVNVLASLEEDPLIRYYQPNHHPPLGPLANAKPSSTTPAHNGPSSSSSSAAAAGGTERWRSALAMRAGAAGSTSGRGGEPLGDCVSKKLAQSIEKELHAHKQENEDFPKPSDPPRPQSVLFVVDRSMDPVAPFLHEFTYQAMVNDLLPVDDGKTYKYQFQSSLGHFDTKEAKLSDSDSVWTDVRHMHMRDAIDKLMGDFNGFLKEHGGFSAKQGAVTLNDMKDMLASLPQYQEMREKFSLHLSMAQSCMDLFETKKLSDTGMVEQNCATGVTPEGKTPKSLVDDMVPLLGNNEAVVTRIDKVRIVALYILYKDGVPDEDRRRLFQHAKLSISEQDAVNNLVHLGLRVVKNPGDREGKKRLKQKPTGAEDEYELSRFKPVVRSMLEEHVSGKLDPSHFPYLRNAPNEPAPSSSLRGSASSPAPSAAGSLRSQRPNWARAAPSGVQREGTKQRLIIFVAGGITYSEMRTAYQVGLALGKEVIIGSTHVITPESFVTDLKAIGRSGVGANPPNIYPLHPSFPLASVRPPKTPRERYQIALDKRYWTTVVPPPPPPQAAAPPPPPHSHGSKLLGGGSSSKSSTPTTTTSSSGGTNGSGKKEGKESKYGEDGEKKKKKGFLRF